MSTTIVDIVAPAAAVAVPGETPVYPQPRVTQHVNAPPGSVHVRTRIARVPYEQQPMATGICDCHPVNKGCSPLSLLVRETDPMAYIEQAIVSYPTHPSIPSSHASIDACAPPSSRFTMHDLAPGSTISGTGLRPVRLLCVGIQRLPRPPLTPLAPRALRRAS